MNCILLREYDVYVYDLHDKIKNAKIYMHHGSEASMVGPFGYNPNRYIYLILETHFLFTWLSIKGIGQHHWFDDKVLEQQGWL